LFPGETNRLNLEELSLNGTWFLILKNEKIRENTYEMESLVALHKKFKSKGYSI
jgi:hypothetical protein